ncbi:MAG TPA: DUF2079 domain-containing protein [Polyangiaceae bacterium]|nr:DUF2079 domain-containing protein [Polyangiaceae bacterium]
MTGSEPDFDEKAAGEAEQEDEELDSSPDSEDAEPDSRDSEEPSEPEGDEPPEDRSQPDEDRWGIGSRVLALSALLGSALLVWTQFAFRSRWIADFIADNRLESPDQRGTLLAGVVGGLVLGGAVGAGALTYLWNKRRSWQIAEQWAWFVSPLIALPIMPIVFRYKPWQNRHQALLLVVLVGALVLETLLVRSFSSIPEAVRVWWAGMKDQLPPVVQRQGPRTAVIAAALGYALFMSFYFVRWHYKLRTHNFDLSINNNLIYGGLHGKFLESTVVFPTEPGKYLANHAKFGTYLFLPLYALFPKPETLLVLQSFMLGLSALPLYGFARRHVSNVMAAAVALTFLCYYPMHSANFSEFQNVPIATFFLFSLVWAAETRRWLLCGLATAAALLLREDIPIGVAVIGGFLLLSGHRPFQGFVIACSALTYFVYLRFHVMDDAGEWWYPNMYKELWADGEKGYKSVIKTLITNPLFVLSKLVVEKKLVYLLHLLVPVAFLPARRWYLWAAFVPGIFLTLLVTNYDPPTLFSFHYVMHWAPYLFLAVPLALAALGKSLDSGVIRMRAAAITMVCASLVLTYNYGAFAARPNSLKGGYNFIDFGFEPREAERYERLQSLVELIPKDASVAATETVGPHVSSRVKMFTMRHGPMGAEYVLASSKELKLSRTKPTLKAALESGQYGVIKRVAEFALLKKGANTSQNSQLVIDWQL